MIALFSWLRWGLVFGSLLMLVAGLLLLGNPPPTKNANKEWENAGQRRIHKTLGMGNEAELSGSFASVTPLALAAFTEYRCNPMEIQDAAKGLHEAELQILDEAMKLTGTARDEYIQAHATVVEQFNGQDPKAIQLYASALKAAKAKPDDYKPVHDDPVGILVYFHVFDPGLRSYYVENRDWLSEVLATMSCEDSTHPRWAGESGGCPRRGDSPSPTGPPPCPGSLSSVWISRVCDRGSIPRIRSPLC